MLIFTALAEHYSVGFYGFGTSTFINECYAFFSTFIHLRYARVCFLESRWVSDQALALYINSKFFPTAVSRFRKFFSSRATPELRGLLIQMGPSNAALKFLFPIFAEFCISEFSAEINRYRELVSTADLTKPDAWYGPQQTCV